MQVLNPQAKAVIDGGGLVSAEVYPLEGATLVALNKK